MPGTKVGADREVARRIEEREGLVRSPRRIGGEANGVGRPAHTARCHNLNIRGGLL
jgi:hypothetical protein